MLDIQFIRDHPDEVQRAAVAKKAVVDIAKLLEVDAKHKTVALEVQAIREERNAHVSGIKGKPTPEQITVGKAVKEKLDEKESHLTILAEELHALMVQIPNPAKPDVKIGADDSENEVIRTVGTPRTFDFTPKDHLDLGEALDMIDVKQAAQVSGARFAYLKNDGALLEYALKQFAFDVLLKEGFIPVVPPVLIHKDIMDKLGYTAMGEAENIYEIKDEDLYLVGTAEQSLVPLHMNDVLKKEELPKRYVGYSTSFRRESGTYGKDTRGIFRVHQFDKVEMVSFVEQGDDDREHEYLLGLEEKFFQLLGIPYHVLRICTGDLGFNAARKFDIEAWIPSQNKYREVTSASTVTDFQSRRLNMRYQDGSERKYMHVLNGTAFSMNRPMIAIMENYQQEDGSIIVPEVLRKYMGKDTITPKK